MAVARLDKLQLAHGPSIQEYLVEALVPMFLPATLQTAFQAADSFAVGNLPWGERLSVPGLNLSKSRRLNACAIMVCHVYQYRESFVLVLGPWST